MDLFVAIEDLLPFMNKKFFNYFVHYLPKDSKSSSFEVYNNKGLPYICYLEFENLQNKNMFIKNFENKNFPNLDIPIKINSFPMEIKDLDLKEVDDQDLVIFKCKYDRMADESFEKNFIDPGLVFIDYLTIEKQREAISYLVKKIGSHLLKGESVMNISLPVFMFDERSLLET